MTKDELTDVQKMFVLLSEIRRCINDDRLMEAQRKVFAMEALLKGEWVAHSLLPQRDIPTLIESLRIRALALTGEAWERNATRDMMKEAADALEAASLAPPTCPHCELPPVLPDVCTPEIHAAIEKNMARDWALFEAGREHAQLSVVLAEKEEK